MTIISSISAKVFLPEDQVRGFAITMFSLLLSFFLPKIKILEFAPLKRQYILISLGIFYQLFMFGNDLFLYHLLPTIIVYYLIAKTRIPAVIIFLLVMGYNLILNVERMINRYGVWDLQIDSAVMIWMQNVSSVAWDYREGKITKDNLSFLSFLEYVYFYIYTCFGPFIQYNTVQDYMKARGKKGNTKLMFRSMIYYIVLVFAYTEIQKMDPYNYMISDNFKNNVPYLLKLFLMMCVFIYYQMIKYPGAWSSIDMSIYLSGIGYYTENKDGKMIEKWDKVQSIKLPEVFTPCTLRDFIQAWNVSAQFWLKEYIFHKIVPKDKIKEEKYKKRLVIAEFLTFLVSGIWHGLYPGYIIFFTSLFFLNQIWKYFYKYKVLYFNWIPTIPRNICAHLVLICTISYFSSSFLLLEVAKVKKFYAIIGYWPFFLTFAVFLFTKYQDYSFLQKIQKEK